MSVRSYFLIFVCVGVAHSSIFSKKKVRIEGNVKIDDCSQFPLNESVRVRDLDLYTTSDGDIVIGGTLFTDIILNNSIKATVSMQRKVLGLWVPMPCIKGFGSCDYDDLCQYGMPQDEECMPLFQEHDVPCRCPVPRGNYSLPGGQFKVPTTRWAGVMKGNYRGKVQFLMNNTNIACYNGTFKLE